jgi:hypothetical protein
MVGPGVGVAGMAVSAFALTVACANTSAICVPATAVLTISCWAFGDTSIVQAARKEINKILVIQMWAGDFKTYLLRLFISDHNKEKLILI